MGVVGILHQPEEQLELYALGRLPEPRVAEVEEHLLVCAACREQVDDLEAYALAMRQAISTEPANESSRFFSFQHFRLRIPILTLAASLAAVVFAVTLYNQFVPRLSPLATLQLTAMRGAMPSVPPSRETDITLADAPAGSTLRAEVVDAAGSIIWQGDLAPASHRIALSERLATGNYFVRLFDSNGKLLHEYGFLVRGTL